MSFSLSPDQLLDISRRMRSDLATGLSSDDADLLCIPTFIPRTWPPSAGKSLAVDMGGTNARCAVVSLDEDRRFRIDDGPIKERIPLNRGVSMNRERFLAFLSRLIRQLSPPRGLPVGFCFSYPARPTPDGDAVILNWTKELFVENTVGEKVGGMLLGYLEKNDPGLIADGIFVINDTVATLLAGMASARADKYIGLIAGTGTNMAILLPQERVSKIKGDVPLKSVIPINMESGNFNPPHLTDYDRALDASSSNPSRHCFEKAVSGMYLPYLFKLACPKSSLDPVQGSGPLFDMAYAVSGRYTENSADVESFLARQIIERSAALIAGALAGVIDFLSEPHVSASICITAEGGLFYAHPRYREIVSSTLDMLLRELDRDRVRFEIRSVTHANLLGCAIAGLSSDKDRRIS